MDSSPFVETLVFNDQGLIPVVVQQADTREVLMVAWMNADTVKQTLQTGKATYWSRSRSEVWVKGETSGNSQRVISLAKDCDSDTLLLTVDQAGSACHAGTRTCFDDVVTHPEVFDESKTNPKGAG
jgi:phosphoribosyl-AMP cyclohydrolase